MGGRRRWEEFKTYKRRGEWVELLFMAAAAEHGFGVLKPWGDSLAYDVGIDYEGRLIRVQVKSTTVRTQFGYLCQFKPNPLSKPYTLEELDVFAAFVIPEKAWYLIPAELLLRSEQKAVTIFPKKPLHPDRYRFEGYLEAWGVLTMERRELGRGIERRVKIPTLRLRSGQAFSRKGRARNGAPTKVETPRTVT